MSGKHMGAIGSDYGVINRSNQKKIEKREKKIFFDHEKYVFGTEMPECLSKWAINLINEQISWRAFEWCHGAPRVVPWCPSRKFPGAKQPDCFFSFAE